MTISQWNSLVKKAEHIKPTEKFTRENFAGEEEQIEIVNVDNFKLTFVNNLLIEVVDLTNGRTVKSEELTQQNYENDSTAKLQALFMDLQKELARRERLETEELIDDFNKALDKLRNHNVSLKITGKDEFTQKVVDGTYSLDKLVFKAFL